MSSVSKLQCASLVLASCASNPDDDCALDPGLCGTFGADPIVNARGRSNTGGAGSNAAGGGGLMGGGGGQDAGGEVPGSENDGGGAPPPASGGTSNPNLENIPLQGFLHMDANTPTPTTGAMASLNFQDLGSTSPGGYIVVVSGATWCGYCRKLADHFSPIANAYAPPPGGAAKALATSKNTTVIYVVKDKSDEASLKSYATAHQANYSVVAHSAALEAKVGGCTPHVAWFKRDTGALVKQQCGASDIYSQIMALP